MDSGGAGVTDEHQSSADDRSDPVRDVSDVNPWAIGGSMSEIPITAPAPEAAGGTVVNAATPRRGSRSLLIAIVALSAIVGVVLVITLGPWRDTPSTDGTSVAATLSITVTSLAHDIATIETDTAASVSTIDPATPNIVSTDGTKPVTSSLTRATGGTPLPDIEDVSIGDTPLPLGTLDELPDNEQLDFLFELCPDASEEQLLNGDGCFRDAHFLDPNDPSVGSGRFPAGRPFHIREGFVNDGSDPLGAGFDVAIYAFEMDDGETVGLTSRYTSDYILRGETDACGPTYESQVGTVSCEWFVHNFPNGLPAGRWAIWAMWEAPCSTWSDLGLAGDCADPDQVISLFSSGVDSPFIRTEEPTFTEPRGR